MSARHRLPTRGTLLAAVIAVGCGRSLGPVPTTSVSASVEDGGPPGSPCALGRIERARADVLVAEGRLDRARRALDRARTRCPTQAMRTYPATLAVLLALGADEDARALVGSLDAIPELDAETRAALALTAKTLAERAHRPHDVALARRTYLEGVAAGGRGHHDRARERFLAAWSADAPNGEALLGAALATRALGETADARRLLDRAAYELEHVAHATRTVDARNGFSEVGSVRWSAGGDLLVVAHGALVSVFAGPTLREVRTLRALHATRVVAMAIAPDGQHLVTAGDDRTLCIWELAGGTAQHTLSLDADVSAIAVAPDGASFAVARSDHTMNVLTLAGAELATLSGHSGSVTALGWSADSALLASGSTDRTVRVHDVAKSATIRVSTVPSAVTSLAFSPNGAHLAVGTVETTVRVLDGRTLWPVATLVGHAEHATDVAFSPDGTLLATASADHTVRVWNVGAAFSLRRTFEGHVGRVTAIAFDASGTRIASSSEDRSVLLWGARDGMHLGALGAHADPITALAPLPGGGLVVGSADRVVRIVRSAPTRVLALRGHASAVLSVAATSELVASGSDDDSVRLFRADDGAPVAKLTGHKGSVASVTFSADAKTLVSGAHDGTVRWWDVATHKVREISRHPPGVSAVAFVGAHLVSGALDGTLQTYASVGGKPVATWRHGARPIHTIVALDGSPGAESFASGSYDGSIARYSLASPMQLGFFAEHEDAVTALVARAGVVASASLDGTVHVVSPAATTVLRGHDEGVRALAFVGGGFVTAGDDGALRFFTAYGGAPVALARALRGTDALYVLSRTGHYDATPANDANEDDARALLRCSIGAVQHPLDLCEERYAVDDLLTKVLAGDRSYEE